MSKKQWEETLKALGGGHSVMKRGMADVISPWHDNCPTNCLPCRCPDEKETKERA